MKKLIISGLAILDILLGVQVIKECSGLKQANQDKTVYQANAAQVNNLQHETKKLNSTTVENVIKKQGIDLTQVEQINDNKINQALDLTYNKTHSDQDFATLKSQLPNMVGAPLADCLIKQNTPLIGQKGKSYPFNKLNSASIAYGEYDLATQTMPIEITVDYQTSSNTHGLGFYSGTFDAKTQKIQNIKFTSMTDETGLQKQVKNNG